MALKTVSQYKDSIAAMLSGIDITQIDDVNGALERAAKVLVQKADIPEASIIQNITLYAGVTDYLCDPRIFGTSINDIRPQGISRNYSDEVNKVSQQQFDRTKQFYPSGTMSTFQFTNGIPTIRITAPFPKQQLVIDTMSDSTQYTLGGTASSIFTDNTFFYQSPASIRFTLNAAGSQGTLSRTLQAPLNLSTYVGVGLVFLAVEVPTVGNISSYTLRLGSSSSNYYTVTQTVPFTGSFVAGQFQLVGFDLSTATTIGSPVSTAINYIDILINYDGTLLTNCRIGGLFASLPSPAQILAQSSAIFLPVGATQALTNITADTDTIILNDAAYTIYEIEGAISICQQVGGTSGSATIGTLASMLNGARARNGTVINQGLYDLYRGDNPSEQIRKVGNYYDNSSSYGGSYLN
jgi:hypothetical protein